jgi:hypothetical protein
MNTQILFWVFFLHTTSYILIIFFNEFGTMKIQFNFSGAPTRLSIQCGFTALDCSNVQIKIAAFKKF